MSAVVEGLSHILSVLNKAAHSICGSPRATGLDSVCNCKDLLINSVQLKCTIDRVSKITVPKRASLFPEAKRRGVDLLERNWNLAYSRKCILQLLYNTDTKFLNI